MRPRRNLPIALAFIWTALTAFPLFAQVEWKTLESEHFHLSYETDDMAARRALKVSQELFDEIAAHYDIELKRPFRVWIAQSPDRFKSLAQAPIRDWAQGFAFPLKGEMAILQPKGQQRYEELERIARHETAHLALGALIGGKAMEAPLWFHEGFAMYVSEPWTLMHRWTLLSNALFRSMIPLTSLDEAFPSEAGRAHLAYVESFSAVRRLVHDHSFTQLKTLLARLQRGEDFEDAFETVFGMSVDVYADEWKESASSGYHWLPVIGGALAVGSFFTPIFLIAHWRRRRTKKARLDAWLEEESKPDPFFR